ncbi:MAG: energy-coupling factor transporter transmembrane component T [Propionicimonas sp.]
MTDNRQLTQAPPAGSSLTRRIALLPKVVFLLGIIVVAMVVTEPIFLLATLVLTVTVTLTAGIHTERLISSLKPLMLIMALLFVFTALTYNPDAASNEYARHVIVHLATIGPVVVQLTTGGIVFGAVFIMKILLMMFSSVYVIASTPMEEILAGLNFLGAPSAIGLMAMIVFRFMPTMLDEVDTIKDAQRARGAGARLATENGGKKKSKAVQGTIPLFVPMIVSSMRRSDTLAMSMVSRGFGFTKRPTQLVELRLTALDIAVTATLIAGIIAVLVARFAWGVGVL